MTSVSLLGFPSGGGGSKFVAGIGGSSSLSGDLNDGGGGVFLRWPLRAPIRSWSDCFLLFRLGLVGIGGFSAFVMCGNTSGGVWRRGRLNSGCIGIEPAWRLEKPMVKVEDDVRHCRDAWRRCMDACLTTLQGCLTALRGCLTAMYGCWSQRRGCLS
ncbi:hypothetical protein ACLB2K_015855 [Fragaria x ananassa]